MAGRLENGSLLLGRLLLASCFIPSGVAKLANIPGFALTLAGAGLPYANVLATGCVVANVFGPLALVVGLAPRLTAGALIVVTTLTATLLHRYWEFGPAARQAEQAAFLVHVGMAAGLLFYLVSGPGAWSWQGFWRRRGEEPAAPAKPAALAKPAPARTRDVPPSAARESTPAKGPAKPRAKVSRAA